MTNDQHLHQQRLWLITLLLLGLLGLSCGVLFGPRSIDPCPCHRHMIAPQARPIPAPDLELEPIDPELWPVPRVA